GMAGDHAFFLFLSLPFSYLYLMTTEEHEAFLRAAIQVAQRSMEAGIGGPLSAVVAQQGEILSSESNQVLALKGPTTRAEVMTISTACKQLDDFSLSGCDLYTSCEPCPMCLGPIYWSRPNRVFYANTHQDAGAIDCSDAFIYLEIDKPVHARNIPMLPMLRDEAIRLFEAWASKENKTKY
ncbi:MAG: nucleoside deaminase, partial [Bacteroidota bacterium]